MATDDADASGKSAVAKRILGWVAAITAIVGAVAGLVENSDHLIKAVELMFATIFPSQKGDDNKQKSQPTDPAAEIQSDKPTPIPNVIVKPLPPNEPPRIAREPSGQEGIDPLLASGLQRVVLQLENQPYSTKPPSAAW